MNVVTTIETQEIERPLVPDAGIDPLPGRRRPDLEHTIAAPGTRDPDKVVEQGRRILRPGTVVTIGRGIERRSQACGIPHVAG